MVPSLVWGFVSCLVWLCVVEHCTLLMACVFGFLAALSALLGSTDIHANLVAEGGPLPPREASAAQRAAAGSAHVFYGIDGTCGCLVLPVCGAGAVVGSCTCLGNASAAQPVTAAGGANRTLTGVDGEHGWIGLPTCLALVAPAHGDVMPDAAPDVAQSAAPEAAHAAPDVARLAAHA